MKEGALLLLATCLCGGLHMGVSFAPIPHSRAGFSTVQQIAKTQIRHQGGTVDQLTVLRAAGDGKSKRKRRRRKDAPTTSNTKSDTAPAATEQKTEAPSQMTSAAEPEAGKKADPLIAGRGMGQKMLDEIDQFDFKPDSIIDTIDRGTSFQEQSILDKAAGEDTSIPLPDIAELLRKRNMEKARGRMEEEKRLNLPKIDRRDKEAFTRALEESPYADTDLSLFEEDKYGTISALLGEGAEKFAGIPSGPLQVGHFIGSLVILLMAFVEYPGFPLTNLPSPLRGALQGGLGTIYLINIILAVLAVFKAGERGQPALLWATKTFSVGGLAYDQLTQLPTLKQIEIAKARKGKRALKNLKK